MKMKIFEIENFRFFRIQNFSNAMRTQTDRSPRDLNIFASDQNLLDNYLIYIDKINNVTITKESEEYTKYTKLTEAKIKNNLFNAYDIYLRKKYEIDINYKALDTIENYFR